MKMLLLLVCAVSAQTLFYRLDPHSVSEQLAYYELYPETPEGQKALSRAWELLEGSRAVSVQATLNLFAHQRSPDTVSLTEAELKTIDQLGARLLNRKLKGYGAKSVEELVALDPQEIDLGRALLITTVEDQADSYEATLDLMALQVLARTSFDAPPEEKIAAINRYLFEEVRMRFPPHSKWKEDVDLYTFLPSILDSRRGVCLGVSALYLCIAQRIGLDLEIITPPGHIYVRLNEDLNIETTARGIHLPSETYLSVHTKELQERNIKEVVGMTFMNQAAALWQADRIDDAITAYETALPFIPDDPLCQELLGYCYLIQGRTKEGRKLLKPLRGYRPDHSVVANTLIDDILDKKTSPDGVAAVFQHVDETHESIVEKQQELIAILKDYPKFRAGHFALAITYLQLGRQKEAIAALEKHRKLDGNDPVVEYYLSAIYGERFHFPKSWQHLQNAEKLCSAHSYQPRPLKDLRRALSLASPL